MTHASPPAKPRQGPLRDAVALAACLAAVALVALWVAGQTGADLLAHSAFDSYAKQAMAWRDGRIALDQNYPWLELAIFEGDYYVSFPPIPAIPMWILSFFFGENTPSGLMTLLYLLGSVAALFFLFRRYLPRVDAAICSAFVALGGSVLDLAVSGAGFSGGVWYQAQLLDLLLTALAFCLTDRREGRGAWAAGLICIALAVGCRPFNAIYVPVLLLMLYRHLDRDNVGRTLLSMLPYVVVPALIAVAYGVYNYARFGNPLEFGHAYLPEHTRAVDGIFMFSRIGENIRNIFRPVSLSGAQLSFPVVCGFAVYLTNPLLFMTGERTLERATWRGLDLTDALLSVSLLAHALLLLSHRTNGGWQYGTRYLCDLLPAACFLFARGRQRLRSLEYLLIGGLIVFNVYASIVFHTL